jgi:hypothetical protein
MRQIGPALRAAPGFVTFVILDEGAGVLTTVSVAEDPGGFGETDGQFEQALRHLGVTLPNDPQVTTGEILFQRGL